MYYDAVDANLLHSTLWNYTADNTHKTGDGWNDEDLSIFSEGKERAPGGWKRPYPAATAGIPLAFSWDRKKKIFTYRFRADKDIQAPTEIFLPEEFEGALEISFGPGESPEASVSRAELPLSWEYRPEKRRLFLRHQGREGELELQVRIKVCP
jgi:hypothetical protein